MKKRYFFLPENWFKAGLITAFAVSASLGLQAQTAPAKLWDKSYGGSGGDALSIVKQTSDGGYIMGGGSDGGINGDKSQASKGGVDFWVLKTDASGNKTWDKTFGGGTDESYRTLQQTADGGYILGGYSNSGLSGDKSQASKGDYDYWVVKIDATGTKVWDKTFGGSAEEKLFFVQQTTDGGYILGGGSKSGISGDRSQASQGDEDFWVVKIDATGNKTWDKAFGGSALDELVSLQQTADGGYILGGYSMSGLSGDKSQASKGGQDFWVVKIDATGTKQWDKSIGGSGTEGGYVSIIQTTDGGYAVGGLSASGIGGDKSQANVGDNDFWIVKLDATGTKTWDKTFGGASADAARSLQQTLDGGYIMGGNSLSGISGDRTEASRGAQDLWIVKLNASGTKTWDKTLGTSGTDFFNGVRQNADGSYIVGGYTNIGINGDKSQATLGGNDYWVVKLAGPASTAANDVGVSAITSANSGCGLTNAETITITVNNIGTAPQSNIPVSYKIGATGTPVTGVVPGPIASNASVTYSFTQKADLSALATYSIEAKTNLTGDALASNDAVTKIVTNYSTPATPAVTAPANTTLCSGGTVVLTAASSTTGVTYQWFNNGTAIANATSATYSANAAGSYTAKAVVGGTCSSAASNAIALTVTTSPSAPGINISGSAALCAGDSVTLTAASTVTGATFSWFKGGNLIPGVTSASYVVKTAGSYTATATAGGCTSAASVARVISVNQLPATPTVTKAGFVLTSSATTGNQWYKNGAAISGAITRIYTVTSNGTYTVKVTNGTCSSLASAAVVVTNVGVSEDKNNLAVNVYPNPSNGIFSLELPKGKAYSITVSDLTGKVVKQLTANQEEMQLNLNDASKGIYLLKIVGEGKIATRKLVVE